MLYNDFGEIVEENSFKVRMEKMEETQEYGAWFQNSIITTFSDYISLYFLYFKITKTKIYIIFNWYILIGGLFILVGGKIMVHLRLHAKWNLTGRSSKQNSSHQPQFPRL